MIRVFEAFAGIGAFRSAFEKVGGYECVGWCEIDRYAQKAYRALYDTRGDFSMRTSQKSITEACRILICSLEARHAKAGHVQDSEKALRMIEEICSSNTFVSLKPKDPSILWLKMSEGCLVIRRGEATKSSLKRFANWGIAYADVCLTAQISALPKTGKERILSGILEKDAPSKYWLSEKAAMKIAKKAEKKQS